MKEPPHLCTWASTRRPSCQVLRNLSADLSQRRRTCDVRFSHFGCRIFTQNDLQILSVVVCRVHCSHQWFFLLRWLVFLTWISEWHNSVFLLISLETPCHHTDIRARSRHFVVLVSGMDVFGNSVYRVSGIAVRSSYVRRPSSIDDKCPYDSKNSLTWSGTSSTCVGHARYYFSLITYLPSASLSVLEQNATGWSSPRWSCIRTPPIPYHWH